MAVMCETIGRASQEKSYTWHDIENRFNKDNTVWIVINNQVFDVTKFLKHHPGGMQILKLYSNQDASVSLNLF